MNTFVQPEPAPMTAEAVETLAGQASEADQVAPLGEQSLLRLRHPIATTRHYYALSTATGFQIAPSHPSPNPLSRPSPAPSPPRHGDDSRLLGYAQVDIADGSAELVVHPEFRHRGVGTALLNTLRHEMPNPLSLWAHGNTQAAQGFASARGLRVIRELLRMELTTNTAAVPAAEHLSAPSPSNAPDLPAGIRLFEVGRDEEALLNVNAAAFATHREQGRMTREDFDQRAALPWFRAEGIFLDEDVAPPHSLRGFLWTKLTTDSGRTVGEIYVLGVSPQAQGQGVGSRLTSVALRYLAAEDVDSVELYVEGDNTAALRTYRKVGFEVAATDVQYS